MQKFYSTFNKANLRSRGYSLIELMVVVGISTVIASGLSTLIISFMQSMKGVTETANIIDLRKSVSGMLLDSNSCMLNFSGKAYPAGSDGKAFAIDPAAITAGLAGAGGTRMPASGDNPTGLSYFSPTTKSATAKIISVGDLIPGSTAVKVSDIYFDNFRTASPNNYLADLEIVYDLVNPNAGFSVPRPTTVPNVTLTTAAGGGAQPLSNCVLGGAAGGAGGVGGGPNWVFKYAGASGSISGRINISQTPELGIALVDGAAPGTWTQGVFTGKDWCGMANGGWSTQHVELFPPPPSCPQMCFPPWGCWPSDPTCVEPVWSPPDIVIPKTQPFIAANPLKVLIRVTGGGPDGSWTCSQNWDNASWQVYYYNLVAM